MKFFWLDTWPSSCRVRAEDIVTTESIIITEWQKLLANGQKLEPNCLVLLVLIQTLSLSLSQPGSLHISMSKIQILRSLFSIFLFSSSHFSLLYFYLSFFLPFFIALNKAISLAFSTFLSFFFFLPFFIALNKAISLAFSTFLSFFLSFFLSLLR